MGDQVVSFNVYSPLALAVALPGVLRRFLNATSIEIRATTHQVIGWSADETCVADQHSLQYLLAHFILYGSHANLSKFNGAFYEQSPVLLLSSGKEVELGMSEK